MSDESTDDEAEPTTAERIAERSQVAAMLWQLSESLRIVGYSVGFLGPWGVAVFWLFDALKARLSPEQFPNQLKEWYFYVGLASVMLLCGLLTGWASERVRGSLESRFLGTPVERS